MSYMASSAQFSKVWCNLLKEHYQMKIDVYKETRKILNSGILPIKRLNKDYSYTDQRYCMAYTFSHNYKNMGTINCLLIMILKSLNETLNIYNVRDLTSLLLCMSFLLIKTVIKDMIKNEFNPMAGISPG